MSRVRRTAALLVAIAAAGACSREVVGPPPPAPAALASPAEAVPGDLDVVVRIDLSRMRDALGDSTWRELSRRATPRSRAGDAGTERFMTEALARADLAYVALRPAASPESLDNVVALSGAFRGLDPRRGPSEPPWRGPIDLGGTVFRYDRDAPGQRALPARIYLLGDERLVAVSQAELDSVERTVELGKRERALDAPAQGAISVAARLGAVLPRLTADAPMLASLLEGARELEASADLTATGLRAKAALKFDESSQAGRFARELTELAERLAGGIGAVAAIARATRIETLGTDVTLRVAADRSLFGEIATCAAESGCL